MSKLLTGRPDLLQECEKYATIRITRDPVAAEGANVQGAPASGYDLIIKDVSMSFRCDIFRSKTLLRCLRPHNSKIKLVSSISMKIKEDTNKNSKVALKYVEDVKAALNEQQYVEFENLVHDCKDRW